MPIDGKTCTDIAAAMYVEHNNKNRRVNSFMRISIDLQSSKLISKVTWNKSRYLMAYLQSRDHALAVILSAKELRNSNENFVRTNVFINPNLTKAEVKAQFELRQLGSKLTKLTRVRLTNKKVYVPLPRLSRRSHFQSSSRPRPAAQRTKVMGGQITLICILRLLVSSNKIILG